MLDVAVCAAKSSFWLSVVDQTNDKDTRNPFLLTSSGLGIDERKFTYAGE